MRFSEQHGITRPDSADWFDLNVEMDSPLYVDPFLLFDDDDAHWSPAHDVIVDFFESILGLLERSGGHRTSMHWAKAERSLRFPEPNEFALGFAMGHPDGSGIGPELAREICDGLDFFRTQGRAADERLLAMVAILVPKIGMDRISDMVCNILKREFISYTQNVCRDLHIPLTEVPVVNAEWDFTRGRWRTMRQLLPKSPVTKGGVLLTPQRFLKEIPRVTPDAFWSWAEVNENASLRFDLNYDLSVALTTRQKAQRGRELARRNLDLLERYTDAATVDPIPYDVDGDPKGIVRWEEAGRAIASASEAPAAPDSQEDFESWLIRLAETFKTAVEDNGLWKALWNDGNSTHRPEAIAQVVARTTWIEHCRARDVDVSREVDCGRGPVDFKFARGWQVRGLIELKHISSSQFNHGAATQLPIYLRGEQATFGVYLCIGYADTDFREERLTLVTESCDAISSIGPRIVPIFVDARPKLSASKA